MQITLTSNERSLIELFSRVPGGAADPGEIARVSSLLLALQSLFNFPNHAVLLWSGCARHGVQYQFPAGLIAKWKIHRPGSPDARMYNGPSNSVFLLGGGTRPSGWELDHIYDDDPLWSATNGLHFTQSAGLVAMPRHLHRRRHLDSMLSWLVRGIAFHKFGYDPLLVFSQAPHDPFGFVAGRSCEIFWPEADVVAAFWSENQTRGRQ